MMKSLADYSDAFLAIKDFESALCDYTGAPYCVTTDSCTHAIELALRITHDGSPVAFPARTYLSVLMTMHILDIPYELKNVEWRESYRFDNTNIWDCARHLAPNMYQTGTIQCLSFGRTKPLELGRGGCLLTDDATVYQRASMMRADGRDIFKYSIGTEHSWDRQQDFNVGYHYIMRPGDCVEGLNLLKQENFTPQVDKHYDYPDCRTITIKS